MNLSSDRSIGGFFGLECPLRIRSYHDGAFAVNSARNAFRLILLKTRPRTVHLPGYLCSSMRAPLDDLGFQFETYAINERLEPATAVNVGHNDLVLAVNYFGLKATGGCWSHIRESSSLLIDNSQAFFRRHRLEGLLFTLPVSSLVSQMVHTFIPNRPMSLGVWI